MQRLPTNVRMVLASTSERAPLEELTTMADKILDVATPFIATVSAPSQAAIELEQLRAENASLREQVSALWAATGPRWRRSHSRNRRHPVLPHKESAGITADWVTKLVSALCHVQERETGRPAINGDEFCWPSIKSPFLYCGEVNKVTIPGSDNWDGY